MNAAERQGKIVSVTHERGSIMIPEICEMFDISEMTARRDLNELDRQGLLRRVHGGAIANLGRSYEPPFRTRSVKNQSVKVAIGLKAAELVYDGDSIALDVGTTTLEIVRGLKEKRNLTIITSCLPIANLVVDTLSVGANARLILTGGILRAHEHSMVGTIPQIVYQGFHVDKAFIGIGGISLEDGLTEYNIDDTEIKRMLIRSAREKIIVADSSKFGVTTFATVGPLTAVDRIVTDRGVSPSMVEEIRSMGIEIILAG